MAGTDETKRVGGKEVLHRTANFLALSDGAHGAVVVRRDDPSAQLHEHSITVDTARIAMDLAEKAFAIGVRTLRVT